MPPAKGSFGTLNARRDSISHRLLRLLLFGLVLSDVRTIVSFGSLRSSNRPRFLQLRHDDDDNDEGHDDDGSLVLLLLPCLLLLVPERLCARCKLQCGKDICVYCFCGAGMLLELPSDIQQTIVEQWLSADSLVAIARLDVAFASSKSRPDWLALLLLVTLGTAQVSFKDDHVTSLLVEWVRSRRVRCRHWQLTKADGLRHVVQLFEEAPHVRESVQTVTVLGYFEGLALEQLRRLFGLVPNAAAVTTHLRHSRFTLHAPELSLLETHLKHAQLRPLDALRMTFESRRQVPASLIGDAFGGLRVLAMEKVAWSDADVVRLLSALPALERLRLGQMSRGADIRYADVAQPTRGPFLGPQNEALPLQPPLRLTDVSLSAWTSSGAFQATDSVLAVYIMARSPACRALALSEAAVNPLCLFGLHCLFAGGGGAALASLALDCGEFSNDDAHGCWAHEALHLLALPAALLSFSATEIVQSRADAPPNAAADADADSDPPYSLRGLCHLHRCPFDGEPLATRPLRALRLEAVVAGACTCRLRGDPAERPERALLAQLDTRQLERVCLLAVDDLRGGDLWRLVALAPRLLTVHVELAPQTAEATFARQLHDAEAAAPAAVSRVRSFCFAASAGLVLQALQRLVLPAAPQLETLELVARGPGDTAAAAGADDLLRLLQRLLSRAPQVTSVVVCEGLGATADDAAPAAVGAAPALPTAELVARRLRTLQVSLAHFASPDRASVAQFRDAVERAAPRLRSCALQLPGDEAPP